MHTIAGALDQAIVLIWGPTGKRALRTRLQLCVYCAYAGGKPIGSGWVEFPEGSVYPELHGGAVLEEWRGRGLYSELFAVRLRQVERRHFRFLCVDASPSSRPILEEIGFRLVCATVPMRKGVV